MGRTEAMATEAALVVGDRGDRVRLVWSLTAVTAMETAPVVCNGGDGVRMV